MTVGKLLRQGFPTLRKLMREGFPTPPEKPPDRQTVLEQALQLPMIAPVRLFTENALELKPWWPLLLPLVVMVAWRSYRRERRRIAKRRAKLASSAKSRAVYSNPR